MEASWEQALAYLVILVGVAATYSKTFGGLQQELTQTAIDTFAVTSRYKRVLNLGIAIAVAAAVTVVLAAAVSQWAIVPASIVVGALTAAEASRLHDSQSTVTMKLQDHSVSTGTNLTAGQPSSTILP